MAKPAARQKIFLIIAGIALAALFLEAGLHMAGQVYIKMHSRGYRSRLADDKIMRVVCIGDSFTYGVGAGKGNGYPEQLEDRLKQSMPGNDIEVINLGVPGKNSAQAFNDFKKSIHTLNPDIIIVLIGHNDDWNFKDAELGSGWLGLKAKIAFSRIRIRDFLICLAGKDAMLENSQDADKLIGFGNSYRDQFLFAKAKQYYQKVLTLEPENKTALLELGRCCRLNGEHRQAEAIFKQLVRISAPQEKEQIWAEINDLFEKPNRYPEAVAFYKQLDEQGPPDRHVSGQIEKFRDLDENKKTARSGLKGFIGKNLLNNKIMLAQVSGKLLYDNLKKMAMLSRQEDVCLVFSGYPMYTSAAMIDVSEQWDIPLVRHEEIFSALQKADPETVYFVPGFDRHCVKQGYRVMADNIAAKILGMEKFIR